MEDTEDTLLYNPKIRKIMSKQMFRLKKDKPKSVKKPPLEVIIEKNTKEAFILSQSICTDNGLEKKIYSTCVYQKVKRYNCNVCVTAVFGKTMLFRHHGSRKHYEMMQRSSHPHENFNDELIMVHEKKISMSDCYIKQLLDQCTKEVLIGLEYLVEVIEEHRPYYLCLLCDKQTDCIFTLMNHLQGLEHRLLYLLLFFPEVYKKLIVMTKDWWKMELFLVVRKIQTKLGRLKPWRHEGKLSLKEKRAIRHAIDSGPHLYDDYDVSFAEQILFTKEKINYKVADTVFTEFLTSELEDTIDNDLYKRYKGRDKCRLCNDILGEHLIQKITHPFTGKHIIELVKGIEKYESIECIIQPTLDRYPQPLIGTEYVVEYVDKLDQIVYSCRLCMKNCNNPDMVIDHLVSKKHKQTYIARHMPKKNVQLLKLTGPERETSFTVLFKYIEARLGRLKPFGTQFDLDRKVDNDRTVGDYVTEKIINGKHVGLDRDKPIIIKGMPVPFFSTVESKMIKVKPDSSKEGKSLSKKKCESPELYSEIKRVHSSSSSSRLVKRKRSIDVQDSSPGRSRHQKQKSRGSRSRSSSGSLYPADKMRRLTPDPVPDRQMAPSSLPDAQMPPPAAVESWLQKLPEPRKPFNYQVMKDYMNKCALETWETNYPEDHTCQTYYEYEETSQTRFDILGYWLVKHFTTKLGLTVEEIQPYNNEKTKRLMKIMMESPVPYKSICRPICRNYVVGMRQFVLEHESAQGLSEEELMLCSTGLIYFANNRDMLTPFLTED